MEKSFFIHKHHGRRRQKAILTSHSGCKSDLQIHKPGTPKAPYSLSYMYEEVVSGNRWVEGATQWYIVVSGATVLFARAFSRGASEICCRNKREVRDLGEGYKSPLKRVYGQTLSLVLYSQLVGVCYMIYSHEDSIPSRQLASTLVSLPCSGVPGSDRN